MGIAKPRWEAQEDESRDPASPTKEEDCSDSASMRRDEIEGRHSEQAGSAVPKVPTQRGASQADGRTIIKQQRRDLPAGVVDG
jgi:hypothetical protein